MSPQPATGLVLVRGEEIVDVRTAEIVDLSTVEDDFLAGYLDWIRDLEDQAKAAKRKLNIEIHKRLDRAGHFTREAGPYRIKGQGPKTPDYDGERARAALEILLDEGKIDADAVERCCPLEKVPKPKKGPIEKLRKANPAANDLLAEAEKPVDQESRSAKIERLPDSVLERDRAAEEAGEVVEGEIVDA